MLSRVVMSEHFPLQHGHRLATLAHRSDESRLRLRLRLLQLNVPQPMLDECSTPQLGVGVAMRAAREQMLALRAVMRELVLACFEFGVRRVHGALRAGKRNFAAPDSQRPHASDHCPTSRFVPKCVHGALTGAAHKVCSAASVSS